jgi:hypothetical protein
MLTSLRKREMSGTLDLRTMENIFCETLTKMYEREWLFDHTTVTDIYFYLKDMSTAKNCLKDLIQCLCEIMRDDECNSIVLLANRYCKKYNCDHTLLKMVEEVKMFTC